MTSAKGWDIRPPPCPHFDLKYSTQPLFLHLHYVSHLWMTYNSFPLALTLYIPIKRWKLSSKTRVPFPPARSLTLLRRGAGDIGGPSSRFTFTFMAHSISPLPSLLFSYITKVLHIQQLLASSPQGACK